MLEQAADALNRQDYQAAAELIATLAAERPEDPRVKLYAAKLQEATNLGDEALATYQWLLQHTINPKILAEARSGIKRIERSQAEMRERVKLLERAGIEDNPEPGMLVLEPMSTEHKEAAYKRFAAIMELDLYSARLQLPTRSWRLYRTGTMGELEFYRDRLLQAEIPCFCMPQQEIGKSYTFNVGHFQHFQPKATVICFDDRSDMRSFNFDWSEVTQIVTGMLPIFEDVVVDIDNRQRTSRKTRTLDYVQVCDLHLPKRRSIFRLCSQTYNFCDYKQLIVQNRLQFTGDLSTELSGDLSGMLNGERIPTTSHDNWKNLFAQIQEYAGDVQHFNNFAPFAETAISFPELLHHINPHIELLRRTDSPWDRAFHLYSTLAICKSKQR